MRLVYIGEQPANRFCTHLLGIYSEILNSVPLYAADRSVPKLDFETLYFTIESGAQCRHVFDLYREKAPADFPRTAGLYFRELF